MTRDELIEAAWNKAGKRFYTIISREAVEDVVDVVLAEAERICEEIDAFEAANAIQSLNGKKD